MGFYRRSPTTERYIDGLYMMDSEKNEKEKGQKGSNVCALIFTIIILLTGAALATLGGILISTPVVSFLGPVIGGDIAFSGDTKTIHLHFIEFASIVTIIQGGLIVFFMLLACVAIASSKHTAHCYIGTYVICLLISLAFSAVLFLQGIPTQWGSAIQESFYEDLQKAYEGPNGAGGFSKAFNYFQSETPCCGFNGRQDFEGSTKLNFTLWVENVKELPASCNQTETGCFEELMNRSSLYFGLLVGFSLACIVLQIPAFLNALCLCSHT